MPFVARESLLVEFSPDTWPETSGAEPVVQAGDAWWQDALPNIEAD